METRILIDAIVQQTTLLIAQLATSAGIRAPLAHIADQVFLELATEIEQQGVSRSVAADMFGLALRSYQKKVNRLRGSATRKEQTLWQGALQYVTERQGATRKQVLGAFRLDDEEHVVAVLNDLVAGGLLYCTGRGRHASYAPTPAREQQTVLDDERLDALVHLIWLEIADRPLSRAELRARFPERAEAVDQALALLLADGRTEERNEAGGLRLQTSRVLIPAGSEAGWETAVLDHFRAMCVAIGGKLAQRDAPPEKRDLVGGTTLKFEIHPSHPCADDVKALLARFREQAYALWNRVAEHNQHSPVPEAGRTKVIFYFGQNIIEATAEEQEES